MCAYFDSRRMLFGAPLQTPLRISSILFDSSRRKCAELGLREGDEVTCVSTSYDDVLLDVPGGGRKRVSVSLAVCIEVEQVERPAESEVPLLPILLAARADRAARQRITYDSRPRPRTGDAANRS